MNDPLLEIEGTPREACARGIIALAQHYDLGLVFCLVDKANVLHAVVMPAHSPLQVEFNDSGKLVFRLETPEAADPRQVRTLLGLALQSIKTFARFGEQTAKMFGALRDEMRYLEPVARAKKTPQPPQARGARRKKRRA